MTGRRHGPHALRHSLAATMLADATSYPAVGAVLGHAGIESTKSYLRVDVERLRALALEVPDTADRSFAGPWARLFEEFVTFKRSLGYLLPEDAVRKYRLLSCHIASFPTDPRVQTVEMVDAFLDPPTAPRGLCGSDAIRSSSSRCSSPAAGSTVGSRLTGSTRSGLRDSIRESSPARRWPGSSPSPTRCRRARRRRPGQRYTGCCCGCCGTLRRARDGREAPGHTPTAHPRTPNQPAGEPDEPTSPTQINKTKPLDFVAIGWSIRRDQRLTSPTARTIAGGGPGNGATGGWTVKATGHRRPRQSALEDDAQLIPVRLELLVDHTAHHRASQLE